MFTSNNTFKIKKKEYTKKPENKSIAYPKSKPLYTYLDYFFSQYSVKEIQELNRRMKISKE
jgi:hypothetical protein